MNYMRTELIKEETIGQFKYLICINGENSYIQNQTHQNRRKRLIHFLPLHDGSLNMRTII